jgi:hypothetical protein
MQKNITKRNVKELVDLLNTVDYKVKNIFTLRCEKLQAKLVLIGSGINKEIEEKQAEYASTDDKGNFLREEVVITDKDGASRKESSGGYKYKHGTQKQMNEEIEKIWKEEVTIGINLISKENQKPVYRYVLATYNTRVISMLSGIILDFPVDAEGFVDEESILNFENKPAENGVEKKEMATP